MRQRTAKTLHVPEPSHRPGPTWRLLGGIIQQSHHYVGDAYTASRCCGTHVPTTDGENIKKPQQLTEI